MTIGRAACAATVRRSWCTPTWSSWPAATVAPSSTFWGRCRERSPAGLPATPRSWCRPTPTDRAEPQPRPHPARPFRRAADRDQAAGQGLPLPGLHPYRVHRRPPRAPLDERRRNGPVQPRRGVRSAPPLRARDGMEDLGRCERRTHLQEPDRTSHDLDALPRLRGSARDGPPG